VPAGRAKIVKNCLLFLIFSILGSSSAPLRLCARHKHFSLARSLRSAQGLPIPVRTAGRAESAEGYNLTSQLSVSQFLSFSALSGLHTQTGSLRERHAFHLPVRSIQLKACLYVPAGRAKIVKNCLLFLIFSILGSSSAPPPLYARHKHFSRPFVSLSSRPAYTCPHRRQGRERRGIQLNPYCTDTLLFRSPDSFVLLSGSSSASLPCLCFVRRQTFARVWF